MLKRLIPLLLITLIAVAVFAAWLEYRSWHEDVLPLEEEAVFEVPAGAPLSRVAAELEAEGIVEHAWQLIMLARISGDAQRIQAGEYRIQPGTTLTGLLQQLVDGRVLLHSFTIVEGNNWRDLKVTLAKHEAILHTLAGRSDAEIMAAIGHAGEHPEGRFLPETYHFPRGTTDVEFLKRAYAAMEKALAEIWAGRAGDLPYDSAYDALIMASIIEKETAVPEERDRIAGVFVRRLKRGMRLQTDPTVIYGLGEDYKGDIRFHHLRQDTPYNTYTRKGLPPTPIAMPGIDALKAAVHPAEGDELYFVATEGGRHKFSRTLEEHNRAVRKYQSKRNPLPEYGE